MNLSLRLVQQWAHVCSPLLVRAHSPTYIRSLIERHYFDDYLKNIQLYVKHLRTIKYVPRGAVAILWSFGICSMNVHHKEESVVAIRMSNIPF